MSSALQIIGFVVTFVGAILFLVAAFRQSLLWGLGCLILSPLAIVFLILHWSRAKGPFLIQLVGAALIFAGLHLGPRVF